MYCRVSCLSAAAALVHPQCESFRASTECKSSLFWKHQPTHTIQPTNNPLIFLEITFCTAGCLNNKSVIRMNTYIFCLFDQMINHSCKLNPDFLCPPFSSTTPSPNVRIINGYVTVEPLLTHQEQRRRMEIYATEQHPSAPSSTSPHPSSAQPPLVHSTLTLSCLLAWLLSHILFTC